MNNELVLQLFMFFQFINILIVFIEWDSIAENCTRKEIAGRLFMFFLPSLVILSLIIRPLE